MRTDARPTRHDDQTDDRDDARTGSRSQDNSFDQPGPTEDDVGTLEFFYDD